MSHSMIRASIVCWLLLHASSAHGSAAVCDTMFALSLATDQGLTSCDEQLDDVDLGDYYWNTGEGVPRTVNDCANKVYASPPDAWDFGA